MPLFVAKTKHPDGRIRVDDILDFSGGVQSTTIYWNQIQNKPSTFPPSQHYHQWEEITDIPSTFPPSQHNHLWEEITDKPSQFPPTSHTHTKSEITNLETITTTPTANAIPKADSNGKISLNWFDLSNYALLNGNNTFTGTNLFKPSTDSTTAFRVQKSDGSPVFNVDTVNKRVGIGIESPNAKLDIVPSSTSETPFRVKSLQTTAPLGSELVQNGTFDTDQYWVWETGWRWDNDNLEADHQTGNTASLTQNITVTSGRKYLITFTMRNRTAGSVSITVGGVQAYGSQGATSFGGNATYRAVVIPTSSGSLPLAFNPTSDFNGSIDDVSVKEVLITQPNIVLLDMNNATSLEVRADNTSESVGIGRGTLSYLYGSQYRNVAIGFYSLVNNILGYQNVAIGYGALQNNITGYGNVAIGNNAMQNNAYGNNNTAIGNYALYSITNGTGNFALGMYSLYSNTSGFNNVAIGREALYGNTSGYANVGIGTRTLYGNSTGTYNVAIGYEAGRRASSGSDITSIANSVFLGYDTRALSNGDTNEIVIGHQAIGGGSNSVVIGNDSITQTYLKGKLAIGYTGTLPTPHSYLQPKGSVAFPIISTSNNLTLTDAHYTVLVDASGGNRTITLPSAIGIDGRIYVVKKTDGSTNAVAIQAQSGQTIDGASSISLSAQYATVMLQAYNGNWYVISKFGV
jgi:hypothetical protein